MTEFQRLFLVQARADFAVFGLLRKNARLPACHALHYLQMATEMLGKARAWKHGPCTTTHRAFVGFLRSLSTNRQAQKQLGFEGYNEKWEQEIRKSVPLAEAIEDLAPSLSPIHPTLNIRGLALSRDSHQQSTRSPSGTSCKPLPGAGSSVSSTVYLLPRMHLSSAGEFLY